MKKNEEIVVEIVDHGMKGEGIAKLDGQVIFVPGAIRGEKVKIRILKVTAGCAYGKVVAILEPSAARVQSDCETFGKCGGCSLRHMAYRYTMEVKKAAVENTLKKALGRPVEIADVLPMEEPYFYRNKLQYPVGVGENGDITMGVFAERSHRIIPTRNCLLQNQLAQQIAASILQFARENGIAGYDEEKQTGVLRHVVIRVGVKTQEVMVTLVVNQWKIPQEKALVSFLTQQYPQIKTVVKNGNNRRTNVILGDRQQVLFGDGTITDSLMGKQFKISSRSFYQVNPAQTEKLYSKAIEYAALTGGETVLDLYCGIGTIGICSSDQAGKLLGIEAVPAAVQDARENARLNGVENGEFFVGNVEDVLPGLVRTRGWRPDVVFVDPPRKGCDKALLDTLLAVLPKRVVYVSCNPATLGRDLQLLEEKYALEKVAICDMFPWTGHVECVAALHLK